MKRIAVVFLVLAGLAGPAAAATDPSADTGTIEQLEFSAEGPFRDFDLMGTWAPDCGRPASPQNPHVNVSAPGAGLVVEIHDVGPAYAANVYNIVAARRLDENSLRANVIFRPDMDGEEHQTLIIRVGKGTRRTMYNRVDDGDVRVKDGVALFSGGRTPLLKRCP